jgi:glucose/arabinose dehydrogenase
MTKATMLGSVATGALLALAAEAALAETVVIEALDSQYEQIRVVEVAGGLAHPWSMAFLPDERLLVTEREGQLLLVENGTAEPVGGVPEVHSQNQGGLLDVAVHPDFAATGWVYLTYSRGDAEGTVTALARGRLDGTELAEVEDIFAANIPHPPGRHYGSRIAFKADGTLLLSIGDRGLMDPSQDLTDHTGSIIRLNDDGSIPDDNPFTGASAALPEIWSYGHRNPQGLLVHPVTGRVWSTEHGPRAGDELNLIEPGENYGWPVVSRGLDYRTQEQIGTGRSLAVYTGDQFEAWHGDFFVGSLVRSHLVRVVMLGHEVIHEEELLRDEIGRIRDVRDGPDGFLYVLTDENPGGVYRLEPAD